MIEVIEVHYSNPMNNTDGLFVKLRGPQGVVNAAAGIERAQELARQFSFNPNGRALQGWPISHGLTTYDVCFWFYEVVGDHPTVIENALSGPDCVYQYRQYDPRRARA